MSSIISAAGVPTLYIGGFPRGSLRHLASSKI